jgi:outer membrane receptor protein involved in Fe transport
VIRIPGSGGNEAVDTLRSGLVGALHTRYLVGDGLNLVAGVSQGFRAPNLDDLSAQGCSGQGYDVPNADLENEKSVTIEAGLKIDLFGVLTGSLFYYYTRLTDLVVRVPSVGTAECSVLRDGTPVMVERITRDNAPSAEIHGAELSARLALGPKWSLFAWAIWSRGQVTLDLGDGFEEPLERVAPLSGLAGVRYDFARRLGFAELGLRWADRQDRLSSADRRDRRICPGGAVGCRGTPGYAVVTLRGATRLHDYLQLSLAIENLTNESYRIHGSAIDGAGLSAILALEAAIR